MVKILNVEAPSERDYLVAIDLHVSRDDGDYKNLNQVMTTKFNGRKLDADTTWRIKSPLSKPNLHGQIVKEIRKSDLVIESVTIVIVRFSGGVFSKKTKL